PEAFDPSLPSSVPGLRLVLRVHDVRRIESGDLALGSRAGEAAEHARAELSGRHAQRERRPTLGVRAGVDRRARVHARAIGKFVLWAVVRRRAGPSLSLDHPRSGEGRGSPQDLLLVGIMTFGMRRTPAFVVS